MPEIQLGGRRWSVAPGDNLLDAILAEGLPIPYSCRAGSCHACLLHCQAGELLDARPEALNAEQRAAGWRLACQCRVVEDVRLALFDAARDGLLATVETVDWLTPDILRLRLRPQRPWRYRAGQHVLLWNADGIARPYSLASVPGLEPWLEFHLDCRVQGAFTSRARQLQPGDELRLGEVHGGALHYDPEWQERPLLLMAAGTGLAPLWGLLRQALEAGHEGAITLLHLARTPAEHYLAQPLQALAENYPQLRLSFATPTDLDAVLAQFRLVSRQTIALLCGQPASVEAFARRLYLAGVPRGQTLADVFLPHA
ncbi:MAG: Naphthalene 1,2-dioxygenase/salicylate 5-hydroxylase systems, ferredoxin--NAD(P)(+), reductase component [Stenotrophomonas maltophilia]|nr:MAG: Naphthalene 1,2-dioxygenase/salicylate 5-hydroxylase systems, ferredoxin--NAD(P)(+), reductase component [Stenotrophomonas maltophilia]